MTPVCEDRSRAAEEALAGLCPGAGRTVKVYRRIEEIPRADWESVYPDVWESYGFFKAMDRSHLDQFSLRYLMAYEDGVPAGAATCFVMDYPIETTIQGFLKNAALKVRKRFPGFLNLRALICGQPIGQGRIGLAGDPARRAGILEMLMDRIEAIAEEEKTAVTAYKEFEPSDALLTAELERRGYSRFSSGPNTEMEIRFNSFDEYLMTLSYATRYDLKRKFKKVDGRVRIECEVVNRLGDALDDAHALYMQMVERHNMGLEVMPKEFFARISEELPDKTRFFLWRMDGRLVAFAMCFVWGDRLVDYYLGLDYGVTLDYHLYFVRFRDMMRWAIENGMKIYEMGCTNYDPKKRLDFKFVPLDIHARFRDRRFNRIMPRICEWVKPGNFDPSMKALSRRERASNRILAVLPLVLLTECVDAAAQVMMKKGLAAPITGSLNLNAVLGFLADSVASRWTQTGVLVYTLNFFVWILILERIEVSLAVPLAGLSYAMISVLTAVFLHESVGPARWAGVALIMAGVYLLSSKKTRA